MQTAVDILNLSKEVQDLGLGAYYEVIKLWLKANGIKVPEDIEHHAREIPKDLGEWAIRKKHDALTIPIKIVCIGQAGDGQSVVPESWLDRSFESVQQLLDEIDGLEWRKEKVTATYCCTHAMNLILPEVWEEVSEDLRAFKAQVGVQMQWREGQMVTAIEEFDSEPMFHDWLSAWQEHHKFRRFEGIDDQKLVLACDLNSLRRETPYYKKSEPVGVLTSRLQKSIRAGRGAAKLLYESILALAESPTYSLPSQNFRRTSGCRQLLWRLLVAIMEDASPYLPSTEGAYLSVQDLACLSLLAHADHSVQLNEGIVQKLALTALLVQHDDAKGRRWNWSKGAASDLVFGKGVIPDSLALMVLAMPMMKEDQKMFQRAFQRIQAGVDPIVAPPLKSLDELLESHDQEVYETTRRKSYDYHCVPRLLLELQSAMPFVPRHMKKHSVVGLKNYIWDESSKANCRDEVRHRKKDPDQEGFYEALMTLQQSYFDPWTFSEAPKIDSHGTTSLNPISDDVARTAFLRIFGKKVDIPAKAGKKALQVIVAGDPEQPCRIKKRIKTQEGQSSEYAEGEKRYIEFTESGLTLEPPPAPPGFQWIWGQKKKVSIKASIVQDLPSDLRHDLMFFVEGHEVKPFDGRTILQESAAGFHLVIPDWVAEVMDQALYRQDISGAENARLGAKLRFLGKSRRDLGDFGLFDWQERGQESPIPNKVWRDTLLKLHSCIDETVEVGPVTREGKRMHTAINPLHEGTILRLFNLLVFLYPGCLREVSPLRFALTRAHSTYPHMEQTLESLAFQFSNLPMPRQGQTPKVLTTLWDHQKETVRRVMEGILDHKKRGFGDASSVGAGKTLTAISTMESLFAENQKNGSSKTSGFLVLLPNERLYRTWQDEFDKHTEGFQVLTMDADGSLNGEILSHTVVIATSSRMRQHPLFVPWTFVVIDECLDVQNSEALKTQEAWRQVLASHYGTLMMSATFFRSRFNKLLYMIKMLRTGIPESRDFLDTILADSLICHLPESSRAWQLTTTKFPLSDEIRQGYQAIAAQNTDSKTLYGKLLQYLYSNFDYKAAFRDVLHNLGPEEKALIYARSKEEALLLSELEQVTLYPDKSGRHTVTTTTEGAYGLNDLVGYSTLVTRPPMPDLLPQMKGRLDRPGQVKDRLNLVYLLTENTIEEASLLRLEMAQQFRQDHIMPLAEFYAKAVEFGQ